MSRGHGHGPYKLLTEEELNEVTRLVAWKAVAVVVVGIAVGIVLSAVLIVVVLVVA